MYIFFKNLFETIRIDREKKTKRNKKILEKEGERERHCCFLLLFKLKTTSSKKREKKRDMYNKLIK